MDDYRLPREPLGERLARHWRRAACRLRSHTWRPTMSGELYRRCRLFRERQP